MLKRIKIQGYKSLVNLELNLKPLSVLVGPNASGKSNLLDALQLLSQIATLRHSCRMPPSSWVASSVVRSVVFIDINHDRDSNWRSLCLDLVSAPC